MRISVDDSTPILKGTTATVAGVLGCVALADRAAPYSRARLTDPPAEMGRKARQTLAGLGYPDPPADAR